VQCLNLSTGVVKCFLVGQIGQLRLSQHTNEAHLFLWTTTWSSYLQVCRNIGMVPVLLHVRHASGPPTSWTIHPSQSDYQYKLVLKEVKNILLWKKKSIVRMHLHLAVSQMKRQKNQADQAWPRSRPYLIHKKAGSLRISSVNSAGVANCFSSSLLSSSISPTLPPCYWA